MNDNSLSFPYEIVKTSWGVPSIRDQVTKEILHNPVGPWKESQELYIDQSDLVKKLSQPQDNSLLEKPLVLFDVGLGGGFNALTAVKALLKARATGSAYRRLKIISFEHDLRQAAFALEHFDELEGSQELKEIFGRYCKNWSLQDEEGLIWETRAGSFPELIKTETERPEVIFFDPYSPKVNTEMWSVENFKWLRELSSPNGILLNYSVSTPARVSLLMAGFFVGDGTSTGLKQTTTMASVRLADLTNPLGDPFLKRWGRSNAQLPFDGVSTENRWKIEDVRQKLYDHPQFHGLSPS